ncbi:hypothetical protein HK57_00464 [Aspergillus ustus]|uniref:Uncharacterized protein n=1 Tax=Aspergillus ustus TaxID=40382 RepID=A0A0C1EGE1_ASPUT|nr:hypothetical protein HK57_00464 [Aspergillus ustus]
MPPLTKFWLCTLKDKSQNVSTLTPLLSKILELCASFSNQAPKSSTTTGDESEHNAGPHSQSHAFYTVTNLPGHLLMITGYPSQELNDAADSAYAAKFLPRLFERVQHVWLRQIEVDVSELPVRGERVVVSVSSAEEEGSGSGNGVGEEGKGGWDVWKRTRQGSEGGDGVQGARKGEDGLEKVWVHVNSWNGEGQRQQDGDQEGRSVFYLQKIVGV